MRHVLDTYCSAPPVVALSFASNDPGGKTSVFLDDPLSLVAIEAAKVVRTLARQPANRATLVSSGGADVLLQLMGAKGEHTTRTCLRWRVACGVLGCRERPIRR